MTEKPSDKIMISKKWMYGCLIIAVIIIAAIGAYFYWKTSMVDKLIITSIRKSEGLLIEDYIVFNVTVTVANVGTNDVSGAELVITLYSDHNVVPIITSNTEELGTLEAGWEHTITMPIFVNKNYDIDYIEATIYLGDKILDRHTLPL